MRVLVAPGGIVTSSVIVGSVVTPVSGCTTSTWEPMIGPPFGGGTRFRVTVTSSGSWGGSEAGGETGAGPSVRSWVRRADPTCRSRSCDASSRSPRGSTGPVPAGHPRWAVAVRRA
jgi:hypothetical protein